jgi:hypothetical protein
MHKYENTEEKVSCGTQISYDPKYIQYYRFRLPTNEGTNLQGADR